MDRREPVFLLKINGQSYSGSSRPTHMTLQHTENGKGGKEVVIKINNGDLELIDDPNIQEGKELEWRFGYVNNLSPLFKAKIFAIVPNYDAYSGLTLTLYAYDAVDFLIAKRTKVWRDVQQGEARITESDVALRIADSMGYKAEVEPTKYYYSEISQSSYDLDFLNDVLARDAVAKDPANAGVYRAWVDSGKKILYFKPTPISEARNHVFSYMLENADPSLLNFVPRVQTTRPDKSGSSGVASKTITSDGELFETTADNESSNRQGLGRFSLDLTEGDWEDGSAELAGEIIENVSSTDPLATNEQSFDKASVAVAAAEEDAVDADLMILGDPNIRANDTIEVRNVGRKNGGKYFIHKVVHTIAEGYVCDLELGRNGVNFDASGDKDKLDSDADGVNSEADGNTDSVGRVTLDLVKGEWSRELSKNVFESQDGPR